VSIDKKCELSIPKSSLDIREVWQSSEIIILFGYIRDKQFTIE